MPKRIQISRRKAKGSDAPSGASAVGGDLPSEQEQDRLWEESASWRASASVVENALSGDDPAAARSYLHWLHRAVAAGKVPAEDVSEFASKALERFLKSKSLTLGQAFGTEGSVERRNPRLRAGAVDAIVGLIQFLHDEHGYPLAESARSATAFDVASAMLKRKWKWERSANTLREHWRKSRVGKSAKP